MDKQTHTRILNGGGERGREREIKRERKRERERERERGNRERDWMDRQVGYCTSFLHIGSV
jgi:hypothetical protein